MKYILDQGKSQFNFSYVELKDLYLQYSTYTDEYFLKELPNILHFACFVSYLKELGTECTLSDVGIIHQLVHLISDPQDALPNLSEIREQFNELLKLS